MNHFLQGLRRKFRSLVFVASNLVIVFLLMQCVPAFGTPPPLRGVANVTSGVRFSCALMIDGSVNCWGGNSSGQLAYSGGDTAFPVTAVGPASLRFTQINAGAAQVCGVLTDLTAACWGGTTGTYTATRVPGLTNVISIAVGGNYSCAVLSGGLVECWGSNAEGELGKSILQFSIDPVDVGVSNAVKVVAGFTSACALLVDGTVSCWGSNYTGELGRGNVSNHELPGAVLGVSGALDISVGDGHACVRLQDDSIKCWGKNSFGQLGLPTVSMLATPTRVPGLPGIKLIAAGGEHTCTAGTDGILRCWGANDVGELGNGVSTYNVTSTPVQVVGISNATSLAIGFHTTCAVLADTTARCWGDGASGALGDSVQSYTVSPSVVIPLPSIRSIGLRGNQACAVAQNGTVFCWGPGTFLDSGNRETGARSRPVQVLGINDARSVVAGFEFACALGSNGHVSCWGYNGFGNLGNGNFLTSVTPAEVPGISNATQIAASESHVCARLSDSTVKCWGSNDYGELGSMNQGDIPTPTIVAGLTNVMAVSAGESFSCALLWSGQVKCWGINISGELGDGTTTNSPLPVDVADIVGAISLTSGDFHSCVVLTDQSVKCWGSNSSGELGFTSPTFYSTAKVVPNVVGAVAVSEGYGHSCAIGSTSWCWGDNYLGQLGIGYVSSNQPPQPVALFPNTSAIASGSDFSCALRLGIVACWGNNYDGQVGNGQLGYSTVPQTVVCGNCTSVSLSSSDISSPVGQVVNLTATVSGISTFGFAGTVVFTDSNGTICTTTISTSGTAGCSLGAGSIGSREIVATYSGDAVHGSSASAPVVQTVHQVSGFKSLVSSRILDSRSGGQSVDGQYAGEGQLAAPGVIDLQVLNRAGVPASGVTAVVLNLTGTNATASSYVTAWASGTSQPFTSSLNVEPDQTTPNLIIVPVGTNGKVSLFNAAGKTDLIADIAGYFTADSTLTLLQPSRLLDTRSGAYTIDSLYAGGGSVAAGASLNLLINGRAGIPSSGVGAIALNVTATNASAPGYLTVWPTGSNQPFSSNLNFLPWQTVPNFALSGVGTDGQVTFFNSAGHTDFVADAIGWFPAYSELTSIQPARLVDTRSYGTTIDGQYVNLGSLTGGSTLTLSVAGRGGVAQSGVSAVVLNVTATNSTKSAFLTVWPSDSVMPLASNLNVVAGTTVANSVITKVAADGTISIYNSAGSVDIIVDVVGWF